MLTASLLVVLAVNSVHTQINGEFWWLNKKLNNFRNVQPKEPVIEVLGEFDNDESAKIVFRDDDLFTNKLTNPVSHRREKQRFYEQTNDKIVWPTNQFYSNNKLNENMVLKPKDPNNKIEDEFVFKFPKNEKYGNNIVRNSTETIQEATTKKTENVLSAEMLFNDDRLTLDKAKNIKEPGDQEIVCCILPIQPIPIDNLSSIYFPGSTNRKPRHKRSEDYGGLNQRNFLLLRKISQIQKKPLAPTPEFKIVKPVEDDYVDPYLNIKNSKFQTQLNHKIVTPSYDYDSDEYGDHASELPRPGLIGLYSDHAKSPSSWTFTSNTGFSYGDEPESTVDDYEDDVEDDNFGYSTIDPRKVPGDKKQRGKPLKFTTLSNDVILDAESHTISFQSNPDFQVMQGFKLLNLFRNRIRSKNSRTSTTERIDDSKEFLDARSGEISEVGDEFFEEDQLFGGCGKAVAIKAKDRDKQLGDAASGSHPWMALVVLTKSRHNVLCYATLIHPRAAVTVADCVHG
ncbi:Uncharacterized protein OBRU01_15378 [Operophtera brumata]|uniref:Peptidase S1 domain-containing protein n=1 Tax=Operophtera brumata TaxID=104452 RepID=A0A0L7L521_OPEBR|nr:Uncharacterized protein OBRU01_15378 [Operophtera brumata]